MKEEGIGAPNRTLRLSELEEPVFRSRLDRIEALLDREPGAYLHPSKRWEYPWALDRASLGDRERVLDAGAGASIFPVYLAAEGHDVTVVDVEPPSDGLGKGNGVSVRYVSGDLAALPLPDDVYDTVFCISVIEHLPDARVGRALEELRRVLRPGGRLLLTTDYYEDAEAEIWYEGDDRRFRVDWSVFDEARLRSRILDAPGFRIAGELDLEVDWEAVRPRMRAFHGYPYTSVGVALIRT